jgi:hypothetical protein
MIRLQLRHGTVCLARGGQIVIALSGRRLWCGGESPRSLPPSDRSPASWPPAPGAESRAQPFECNTSEMAKGSVRRGARLALPLAFIRRYPAIGIGWVVLAGLWATALRGPW